MPQSSIAAVDSSCQSPEAIDEQEVLVIDTIIVIEIESTTHNVVQALRTIVFRIFRPRCAADQQADG